MLLFDANLLKRIVIDAEIFKKRHKSTKNWGKYQSFDIQTASGIKKEV